MMKPMSEAHLFSLSSRLEFLDSLPNSPWGGEGVDELA